VLVLVWRMKAPLSAYPLGALAGSRSRVYSVRLLMLEQVSGTHITTYTLLSPAPQQVKPMWLRNLILRLKIHIQAESCDLIVYGERPIVAVRSCDFSSERKQICHSSYTHKYIGMAIWVPTVRYVPVRTRWYQDQHILCLGPRLTFTSLGFLAYYSRYKSELFASYSDIWYPSGNDRGFGADALLVRVAR